MQVIRIIEDINLNKDGKTKPFVISLCMISIEHSNQKIAEILMKPREQDSSVSLDRGCEVLPNMILVKASGNIRSG